MPTPRHLRLRIGGSIHSSGTSWSVGLAFRSATGGDPGAIDGIQAKLEDWRDAVRALNTGKIVPERMLVALGVEASIDYVRTAYVDVDGKESSVALVEINGGILGTGNASLPAQLCVAMSLRTGRPGGSYRGRMYWPAIGLNPSGGRIATADVQQLSQQAGPWIHDLEGAGADILNPQIRCVVLSTAKGVGTPVTQVAVGDRFDVQRRRAEGEDESYRVSAVPQ